MEPIYSSVTIFKQRLKEHFQLLGKLYRSSIDWIVWLYVIIPAIGVILFQYRNLYIIKWEIYNINFDIAIIIYLALFILMLLGNVRFFVERGDQLIYRQYEEDYRTLKKFGIFYSSIIHFIICIILFLAIAPIILVQLEKNIVFLLSLFLITWCGSLIIPVIRQLLRFRFNGWKYFFVYILVLGFLGLIYSGILYMWERYNDALLIAISIVSVLLITHFFLRLRLNKEGTFLEELSQEIMLKYRVMSAMLFSAGMVGAPQFQRLKPPKGNKRPWLFRKSGTIFYNRTPENAFIELHIKYLIRGKDRRLLILQMTGACLFALTIMPDTLKWIIWGVAIFMFIHLNSSYVSEMKRNSFLWSFDWEENKMIMYAMKSVFWTNAPFLALIGAWAGGLLLSWWGFFVLGLVTVCISYLLQPMLIK